MKKAATAKKELKTFLTITGNKTRSSKYILPILGKAKGWKIFFEPFIGAGAILLKLQPKKAVVSDTNQQLINCWKILRDEPEKFFLELEKLKNGINLVIERVLKKIGQCVIKTRAEQEKKRLRQTFRQEFIECLEQQKKQPLDAANNIKTAAYYLVYQLASYRGVVVWDKAGNPVKTGLINLVRKLKIDFENLKAISSYLRQAEIKIFNFDYQLIDEFINSKVLIYLDPPYIEILSGSLKKYGDNHFLVDDQLALFNNMTRWDKKGAKILCSNNESETLRKQFFNSTTTWKIKAYNWKSNMTTKSMQELAIYNF